MLIFLGFQLHSITYSTYFGIIFFIIITLFYLCRKYKKHETQPASFFYRSAPLQIALNQSNMTTLVFASTVAVFFRLVYPRAIVPPPSPTLWCNSYSRNASSLYINAQSKLTFTLSDFHCFLTPSLDT